MCLKFWKLVEKKVWFSNQVSNVKKINFIKAILKLETLLYQNTYTNSDLNPDPNPKTQKNQAPNPNPKTQRNQVTNPNQNPKTQKYLGLKKNPKKHIH